MEKSSWQRLLSDYNYRCGYCLKRTRRLTKDHMLPRARGGETHIDNIVPACYKCNQKKQDKPIWEMLL